MKFCIMKNEISDLQAEAVLKNYSLSRLKRSTDILVIDDEPFTYMEALKNSEFNIEYKEDLSSLKEVEAYQIILCDIKGVGKFLQSRFEGAYLVQQIKEKYPNKTVIIYSGNAFTTSYQTYINYADYSMEKGNTLESWTSLLTKIIREKANPVNQWIKTRDELLRIGAPILEVAKLEDRYVAAIKKESFESLEKLAGTVNSSYKDIMIELLSSTIAKLLKG